MYPYWLYITSFLDLLATSLLVPFLSLHLHSLGLSRLYVGLFTSVYPILQAFSSPAAGYCSYRYGCKQTFVFSLLLCSLAYCLLASTSSLTVIFCCRVMLGMLKHTQTLCKVIYVQLSRSERISKTYGVMNAAEALGFMLGPTVGAQFIETENGFKHLCRVTTALFIVNALIVYYFLTEEHFCSIHHTNTAFKSERPMHYERGSKICWDLTWDIFLLKWLLCISLSLFYTNYSFSIIEQFQVSPSVIGYANSFQGLISVITSLVSGKLTIIYYKSPHLKKIEYCFIMLSFSFLFLSFASNLFLYFVCLIPLSLSSTLCRIYTTEVLLDRSSPQSRGSVIGVENTISSIAFLSSPFICEICSVYLGSSSISIITFTISATGAFLSAILKSTPLNV